MAFWAVLGSFGLSFLHTCGIQVLGMVAGSVSAVAQVAILTNPYLRLLGGPWSRGSWVVIKDPCMVYSIYYMVCIIWCRFHGI